MLGDVEGQLARVTSRFSFKQKDSTKVLNATFIALIPKRSEANRNQDLQPITLISAPYEIIAKVLFSNRICEVLHKVIDGNQLLLKRDKF